METQALTGDLRLSSVSGDLTVMEGSCPSVKADSVSGSIILDLDPAGGPTDIGLTSVSGEIAIRLPHPTDAEVEANTASGTISNAFEDLRVSGPWGAHKVTGRLGTGNGRLKATTVSGSIALLRRPPAEESEPWDEKPGSMPGTPSSAPPPPSAAGRTDDVTGPPPAAGPPDDVTDNPSAGPPESSDDAPGHMPAPTAGTDSRADDTTGRSTGRTTDKKVL